MVRTFLASIAVMAATLGLAPPAAADEAEYLKLQDRLTFLTADQLLREGRWACQAAKSGLGSSTIVTMVQDRLEWSGASVEAANDIVAGGINILGC
ncbi:DUF732 domain-containing protein [Mycobacterium sp. PS03-16]|uniref:DUF732 domain-containing protein n=1 Tax=Mycobacterium sp. PS03-16 TaxID=2559611 RepID=UPI001073686B|nr:DUF732 domain-containing protein [Mycobacterium sp. PS03-16]TFV56792.1 DUF732 domain-containing protein [Mycobacterium sp. PS03-16]